MKFRGERNVVGHSLELVKYVEKRRLEMQQQPGTTGDNLRMNKADQHNQQGYATIYNGVSPNACEYIYTRVRGIVDLVSHGD